ncbi:cytochrome P450 [Phaeosphaeria sp. MPI-PUGE-AT-0046c]|nr:cytochrome P450 [Phaeosphaeria sp. MPI-PUGE-AT-0046c]
MAVAVLGFLHAAIDGRLGLTIVVISCALTIVVLAKLCYPKLDPSEPPAVWPKIPIIGHLLGIIQHQNNYHKILSKRNPSKPCMTIPILNGKIYGVYDPHLIQQVLRARVASFEILHTEFAQKVFGLPQSVFEQLLVPGLIPDFTDGIHQSFQKESLHKMNLRWLEEFSSKMDPLSDNKAVVDMDNKGKEKLLATGIEVENFYLWCRDVMSLATTRALYGDHDPFSKDKSLLEAIWLFEEGIPYFLLSLAPSVTMPRAYQARKRLQNALSQYYTAGHDRNPTASTLTHNRAAVLRKYNWTGEDIAYPEAILPVVATLNAVPTLFWLILYILQDSTLTERIRDEVQAHIEIVSTESADGKTVVMDISKFESDLPLLVSSYRETMRHINHSVSNRRMLEDLTITTQEGQQYLLKKGVDVQLPAGVTHSKTGVWGANAASFAPERFIPPSTKLTEEDRARKVAYIPFGGGRHLCPGRNFAFAEIIAFSAVLILGFDVNSTGMKFEDLKMRGPLLSSGSVKPVGEGKGLGARIKPRNAWANVKWTFHC